MNIFKCYNCKKTITNIEEHVTGYGTDKHHHKICYACCAVLDRRDMLKTGKACLYLIKKEGKFATVSNWPNTLVFPVNNMRTGKHNITGKRYDVWFFVNNNPWHGVTYGDNTQLCHCKMIKN